MPVGTANDWESVTAGGDVTCAIRSGEIYCFGDNTYGQLGIDDATVEFSAEPLPIAVAGPWQEVRTSHSTTCALRSGEIYCWGWNYAGSAGVHANESIVARPSRVGTLADWHSLSVGEGHACALRAGGVYCWGSNDGNQFGTAEPDRDAHPEPVPISLSGD
jgi:alpha-tubulin suppressor-like RCC1 family protein